MIIEEITQSNVNKTRNESANKLITSPQNSYRKSTTKYQINDLEIDNKVF